MNGFDAFNAPRSSGSFSWVLRLANSAIGIAASLVALWIAGRTEPGAAFIYAFAALIFVLAVRDVIIARRLWRS